MTTLSPAPTTVHASGQIVATGLPAQNVGTHQNLQGGLINHAVSKTTSSIRAQANHARAAGVTMRGGRRRRGGANAFVPEVPEGNTIPGTSFTGNHVNLLNAGNQLRASAVYDKLAGTTPYKVGGKRRRRTKKHGRSKHRNIRRNNRKSTHRRRRGHHSVKR